MVRRKLVSRAVTALGILITATAAVTMAKGIVTLPVRVHLMLMGAGSIVAIVGQLIESFGIQHSPRSPDSAVHQVTPPSALQVGAWFGLVAGLGEGAIYLYRRFTTNVILDVPLDILWMAPLIYILILSTVAGFLVLAAHPFPRLRSLQNVAGLLCFVAVTLFLLQFAQLHLAARFVLALGVAAQTSRLIRIRTEAFSLLVRRTFGWTSLLPSIPRRAPSETDNSGPTRRDVIVSGSITLGAVALGIAQEPLFRAVSHPRASPAGRARPNVLFVVWDTVRSANLSLFGYGRRTTPYLERLAHEAITFDMAIAPSSWTLPSHATMFTGVLPQKLSTDWNQRLDGTQVTLAERLREMGYATAGFVANLFYTQRSTGLARGFDHYEDFPRTPGQALLATAFGKFLYYSPRLQDLTGHYDRLNRKSAREVVDSFLNWHAQIGNQPYFAFINLYDAHDPYLPPDGFARRFIDREPRGHLRTLQQLSEAEKYELQAAYDGAIAYLDDATNRLLAQLAARGDLDNTMIVLVSDHGEEFYEHGVVGHGVSLYLPSIHVPLMIRLPNARHAGSRVAGLSSLRDLPATIMETVSPGASEVFPGNSLTRFVEPDADRSPSTVISHLTERPGFPSNYPTADGEMISVVDGGTHYIQKLETGQEELYAIDVDYWEKRNLITTSAGRRKADRLRRRLEEELAS